MSDSRRRGPDQGDADRHRQLHRLPGMPGGLQAVERARGRGDRAGGRPGLPEPGGAQREDLHAHRVPRDGEPGEAGRAGFRLRDAAVPPLPGAGLRLRLPDDGAPAAARRSGVVCRRRVHRLPLLHAGVSLGRADRGLEHARPEDLEVHALRRPRRSAGAGRVQRAGRCPRMRPSSSPTPWRFQPASRRAPPTPCATEPGTRCWRSRTSASPTAPTSTSTTSTERRSWAGRACCTCRECRSRNSASRRTGKSPFRRSPTTALGAVPPAVMAVGALLGASYAFFRKRVQAVC